MSKTTGEPLSTLRGPGVEVDAKRVARVVVVLCLVVVAVLVVVLGVAGLEKNSQINQLANDAVPVQVKVSSCIGLLGGSGSNAAGYACKGSFNYEGRRYDVEIPGNKSHAHGSFVALVAAKSDPALVATKREVIIERASWRVFIVPLVLFVLLVLVITALVVRRRSTTRRVLVGSSWGPGYRPGGV